MQLVTRTVRTGLYALTTGVARSRAMPVGRQAIKRGLLVLALSLSGALISGSQSMAGDWPMFLKDGTHSSYAENSPMPPLDLKWKFETNGPVYSSPVISGGRVFVGSYDHNLYALDAETG